tara:strand:- start:148 stop:1116 length:969 start_codon:yes stop_codon:yes gene_type:complete
MENASSQVSNLLRKESGGESGSTMTPPNPSSTDVGSSFEGVRIAKHAMKKATKKARFLESAFVLLLRSFLLPFAHRNRRSSFSLSFSLLNAQIHTTEIRRTHESSVSKQSSVKSKKKKRKNLLFGLADFAKDLNTSLLETTAAVSMKGGERSKKMSRMLSSALLGGGGKKKGSNTNNKKRELIARVENDRMKMVLKHPTFKENPVKAVLTHLAAQLGESAENDEEDRSKDGTTKKTTKKSTTTTTTNDNNNVDIDDVNDDVQKKKKKRKMMTPARLRQTQGKHHAGGGGQERSKKSIHGGGKNSGGVVKEKLRNKKGGKNRK